MGRRSVFFYWLTSRLRFWSTVSPEMPPLVREEHHPPASPSLLDSFWMGDDGNHRLNTPASAFDLGFRPIDAASPYDVGDFGSSELGDQGGPLSASQASTQLMTHPISTHTDGRDHNTVLIRDCECISCLGIGKSREPSYRDYVNGRGSSEAYYSCRLLGCLHTEGTVWHNNNDSLAFAFLPPSRMSNESLAFALACLRRHEKAHFREEGHFKCLSDHCTFVTKRWSDLKRHSTVMHCKNAKKFACTVPYCKFAGDNNGFLRKDKLTSHFNRVHKGVKAAPRGTLRAIKAAPAKEAVNGAGSASGEKAA